MRLSLALASLGVGTGPVRDFSGSLTGRSLLLDPAPRFHKWFWGAWDQRCVVSEDVAPWLWEALLGSLSVTEAPCPGLNPVLGPAPPASPGNKGQMRGRTRKSVEITGPVSHGIKKKKKPELLKLGCILSSDTNPGTPLKTIT